MVKLAVVAVLSTMLVRFPWFRRILLTEKRDWPERLVFAASLGVPLTAGVLARLLLNYEAADLTLSGSFLAGLLAGPYAGAIVGSMVGIPAFIAGEWIALPFAIGCGFAGGGLREICPKEAIWHFSPLFFTDLHRYVWRLVRRLQIDWVVLLLAAPISLEMLRQRLGHRFGDHRSSSTCRPLRRAVARRARRSSPRCSCVAIPIKIWNSARIEHRLQEQEKLLMAARVDALASQINPHFLFNTLTSISSLIRSQPETARTLIVKLSGLLRRLLRSQEHFVTLREELEAIDEYLDIESGSLRAEADDRKGRSIRPASTSSCRACCCSRWSRTRSSTACRRRSARGASSIRSVARERPRDHRHHRQRRRRRRELTRSARTDAGRHRPAERQRAAARDLRRELPAAARQRARTRARARGSSSPSWSCRRGFRPDTRLTWRHQRSASNRRRRR